jgi:hypothetical protein
MGLGRPSRWVSFGRCSKSVVEPLRILGFGTGSVFDVTADGERFLVNVAAEEQETPPPITVITNWTSTLR